MEIDIKKRKKREIVEKKGLFEIYTISKVILSEFAKSD